MTMQQDCTQKTYLTRKQRTKKRADKTANFCEVGEINERQMANNVNCEEMRFVIRNLVYVEDPPQQRRQKFLLMSARTTLLFPQRGRDDAV